MLTTGRGTYQTMVTPHTIPLKLGTERPTNHRTEASSARHSSVARRTSACHMTDFAREVAASSGVHRGRYLVCRSRWALVVLLQRRLQETAIGAVDVRCLRVAVCLEAHVPGLHGQARVLKHHTLSDRDAATAVIILLPPRLRRRAERRQRCRLRCVSRLPLAGFRLRALTALRQRAPWA